MAFGRTNGVAAVNGHNNIVDYNNVNGGFNNFVYSYGDDDAFVAYSKEPRTRPMVHFVSRFLQTASRLENAIASRAACRTTQLCNPTTSAVATITESLPAMATTQKCVRWTLFPAPTFFVLTGE